MCERIDLGDGNFAIICGGHRARKKRVKLPATKDELRGAGWRIRLSRRCKLCQSEIEFWQPISGKMQPLELVVRDGKKVYVSHFATCPEADKFRRKAKPKEQVAQSGELFT